MNLNYHWAVAFFLFCLFVLGTAYGQNSEVDDSSGSLSDDDTNDDDIGDDDTVDDDAGDDDTGTTTTITHTTTTTHHATTTTTTTPSTSTTSTTIADIITYDYTFPHSFGHGITDPNNAYLFNDYTRLPPWQGFLDGETSLQFEYITNKGRYLTIIIGNDNIGKARIDKLHCPKSPGKIKVILAKKVPGESIPLYNPELWKDITNFYNYASIIIKGNKYPSIPYSTSDAMHNITFQGESRGVILLKSFKLIFNGWTIADSVFDPPLHVKKSKYLYMNYIIQDYCYKKVFHSQNPYLMCAANELGNSWSSKYVGTNWEWKKRGSDIESYWHHPEWCGEFLAWVLQTVNPKLKVLWEPPYRPYYVTNYFSHEKHLYISPYAEIKRQPYRGSIYDDDGLWNQLGTLIKPGFLVSTRTHITMFLGWVDKNNKPVPFNPYNKHELQYMLCIGGSQGNKVTVIKLNICHDQDTPNATDNGSTIIWWRTDGTTRYCLEGLHPIDDPNYMEEGFSDTRV